MSQINRYSVQRVQGESLQQELSKKDEALLRSYDLGNTPFISDKYQLNGTFYTLDGLFLETVQDIKTYTVLGANKKEAVTEISVDPVQDVLDKGYLGDVQIEYSVTNNLFSSQHSQDPESILFIREISSDRTEIRATSTTLSETELQSFAQNLYQKLNLRSSFEGVNLHFVDEDLSCWCLNVMTEVLNGTLVVTFKTYSPLPDEITVRSRFNVLEQIGEPIRFEVLRTVEVQEDERAKNNLKGPNFNVEIKKGEEHGVVTDYLNFQELFSYPNKIRKDDLYSIYKEQGIELSIDHSDFSNFIHFSSAAERLENFRYKLGLVQGYQQELENTTIEGEKSRLTGLIQGIIDNFDHYDRYLYFEKTETSWPKESDARPYVNVSLEEAESWFEKELQRAQEYDEYNPDILVNTVPQVIRSDTRNEPYLVFIHMIGQHFDEEWVYAKAVSTRYNGDNRLDFGIPKDLVREALKSFGLEVETGNQNLERLFNLCVPGEPYITGSEISVQDFRRATVNLDGHNEPVYLTDKTYDGEYIYPLERHLVPDLDGEYSIPYENVTETRVDEETGEEYEVVVGRRPESDGYRIVDAGSLLDGWAGTTKFQPIYIDDYRKEIYKRIYHNIPFLLKTKGTSRGLRALISCFGIPEDLLEIAVAGGAKINQEGAFFGPEHYTLSSEERIRLDNEGTRAIQMFDETTGRFVSGTTLSLNRQIQQPGQDYQQGTHDVEVGFNLNKQFDKQAKDYLRVSSSNFDYDNLIGDPRNIEENYGEAFTLLRNQIISELRGDSKELPIRIPSAILRLVRYYDSALFRTLQDFIPARDIVSTGAIVEDTILHRNRRKKVEPEVKDLEEMTASIDTVFIDGGEGGSLKVLRGGRPAGKAPQTQSFVIRTTVNRVVTESRECPSVDYFEDQGQSIGSEYVPKVIFDDSPKFNGELAGTEYEITNGELNEDNKFKRGGSSQKVLDYVMDYRFYCLPRVPVDTVLQAAGSSIGYRFPINLEMAKDAGTSLVVKVSQITSLEQGGITVSEQKSVGTELGLTVKAQELKGGWLLSILGEDIQSSTNYIGGDPEIQDYASDFVEDEQARLSRSLNDPRHKTILLPRYKTGSLEMTANLNFIPDQEETPLNIWNEAVSSTRQIFPRTVNTVDVPSISLKVLRFDSWKNIPEDITIQDAVDEGYFQVLDFRTQIPFTGESVSQILYRSQLEQIYISVENTVHSIDCKAQVVRNWRGNIDDQAGLDVEIWQKFKEYTTNAFDPKDYIGTRYGEQRQPVAGVLVHDNITGISPDSEGLLPTGSVLLEPYMGCPYIFLPNDTYKLLLIEDWIS